MNKKPDHRLGIWTLADHGPVALGEPHSKGRRDAPLVHGSGMHVSGSYAAYDDRDRMSDLAVLDTLYDYGPSVTVELRGNCTTSNGRSFACKTKTISKDAAHLVYDEEAADKPIMRCDDLQLGTPMHFNLDQIGAFKGVLAAQDSEGFHVAVNRDCKSTLSVKLSDFASASGISFDETATHARQRITRIEPDNKRCIYLDQNGALRKGRLVNVSQVDALITAAALPPIATHIVFSGPRRYLAEVTRTFEIGFAVRFCPPIPNEDFSPAIKLSDE